MPRSHYTPEEICERGEALYNQQIRAQVEPEHRGKFLVLDIETGDYEMDADRHAALNRAEARHPGGQLYILRIGYPTAINIGGRYAKAQR